MKDVLLFDADYAATAAVAAATDRVFPVLRVVGLKRCSSRHNHRPFVGV
jgi:hypothetical protein